LVATEGEDEVACTSLPRAWGIPSKKRKDSTLEVSNSVFEKHDYSKPTKKRMKLIEDFDPRPSQFKGTVKANISKLLDKLDGEDLCISLLLDSRYQQECSHFNTLPITYDYQVIKH